MGFCGTHALNNTSSRPQWLDFLPEQALFQYDGTWFLAPLWIKKVISIIIPFYYTLFAN